MSDDEAEVDVASILARLNANVGHEEEGDDSDNVPVNTDQEENQEEGTSLQNTGTDAIETQDTTIKKELVPKKDNKISEVYNVRDYAEEEADKKKRDVLAEHADTINLVIIIMSTLVKNLVTCYYE